MKLLLKKSGLILIVLSFAMLVLAGIMLVQGQWMTGIILGGAGLILIVTAAVLYEKIIRTVQQSIRGIAEGRLDNMNTESLWFEDIQKIFTLKARLAETEEILSKELHDFQLHHISKEESLGKSILQLQEKLTKERETEEDRNWINNGVNQFIEILRHDNLKLEELCSLVLKRLINYVEANQGGFFVKYDTDDEQYMDLISCYAYNREKSAEKRIYPGNGILGQAMLDHELIHLTELPQEYINITSGLGEKTASAVLIIPLTVNENFYGAIELASFRRFSEREIAFLSTISENIAASIASIKTSEETRALLEESTKLTEELQAKEEETSETLRMLREAQEDADRQKNRIQAHLDTVNKTIASVEFDSEGNVLEVNPVFSQVTGYGEDELQGRNYSSLIPEDEQSSMRNIMMWDSLRSGQSFNGEFKFVGKDGSLSWLSGTLNPFQTNEGMKIMLFAQFVTDDKQKEEIMTQMVSVFKESVPYVEIKPDGTYKTCNALMMDLVPHSKQEIRGKLIGELLPGIDAACIQNAIANKNSSTVKTLSLSEGKFRVQLYPIRKGSSSVETIICTLFAVHAPGVPAA